MNKLLIPSTFVCALFGLNAQGQSSHPRHPVPAPKQASEPRSGYLTEAVDLNSTNVGPDFKGHDIEAVVEAIQTSHSLSPKSEFETTAAYEARRDSVSNQPLFGSVTPTSLFAFVFDSEIPQSPLLGYDADSQIMMLRLRAMDHQFLLESDQPTLATIPVKLSNVRSEKYLGSNAFGATREVEKISAEEYGLAISRDAWFFSGNKNNDLDFMYFFQVPLDQAQAFKKEHEIVLICRLAAPWLHRDVHGHDATLSDPNQSLIEERDLAVTPLRIWVVNKETGAVVRDISQFSQAKDLPNQQRLAKRLAH